MAWQAKRFEELNAAEVYEILKARSQVFLLEQGIICQDTDDVDYKSLHCFCMEGGRICAYLRAFYESGDTVLIGRVLTTVRGTGLGRALMEYSLRAIGGRMPCEKILVHAQKHAAGYYERFGFRAVSGDFLEEGVVHVMMERPAKGE